MHFEAKNLSWSPRVDVRPAPRRVRQRGPTASTSGTVTIDLEVSGDEDAVILHDNERGAAVADCLRVQPSPCTVSLPILIRPDSSSRLLVSQVTGAVRIGLPLHRQK